MGPKDNFGIGIVMDYLNAWRCLARAWWNGKNMFIYLVDASAYQAQTDAARKHFGDMVPYGAYVAMKTTDNKVVPWTISQTDILANDWFVFED